MTKVKRIVRLVLVVGALCAATSPAFAWNHYRHEHNDWHRRWHERNWHKRGRGGPVHPLSRALPNPRLTPGAINPAVTQADIHSTICVRGYTRTIRPPERYTERLKRRQIREYGYRDRKIWHYEEDHLLALSLGGSPTSPENLWPEPHKVEGGWGAFVKDHLEDRLQHLVCSGRITLATAQRAIVGNWIQAYRRYVGPVPRAQHWRERHDRNLRGSARRGRYYRTDRYRG